MFVRNFRAASSGCVRVQNIEELANWLLKGQTTWKDYRIEELKETIERAEKLLKNPKLKKLQPFQKKPAARSEASVGKPEIGDRGNLVERTRHLMSMGHSKEEIVQILGISRAEVDFLESLSRK